MSCDFTELAQCVDALLPQTQCGQCGYAGCRPYAEAIARGEADINRCPPGGEEGVREIATLVGVATKPLDPACGSAKPRTVAFVDEQRCIGCTLCIQACPVDAIVGAAKLMHTVIAPECTGCELCVAPCPVDCIALVPLAPQPTRAELMALAAHARRRFELRQARLAQPHKAAREAAAAPCAPAVEKKARTVARALERARARLAERRRCGKTLKS